MRRLLLRFPARARRIGETMSLSTEALAGVVIGSVLSAAVLFLLVVRVIRGCLQAKTRLTVQGTGHDAAGLEKGKAITGELVLIRLKIILSSLSSRLKQCGTATRKKLVLWKDPVVWN